MNKRKLLTDRQGLIQCHDGCSTLRLSGSGLDRPTLGTVRGMLSSEWKDIHWFKDRGPSSNDNGSRTLQG